ncbi:hypothetical protein E2986_09372 [Frieseomelitta varia]|uniref:C2H2-type domain-containing protein n=1 Tax=Frieseomelitta varia TaxID=561572 RepID=A0A833VNM9_9HYME|nr:hypothetical protein E2986_09372 [Frieseomelitta varia]
MQNVFRKSHRKKCQLQERKPTDNGDCESVWITVMNSTLDQPAIMSDQLQDSDVTIKEEVCQMYNSDNIEKLKLDNGKPTDSPNTKNGSKKARGKCKACSNNSKSSSDLCEHMKSKANVDVQESYQCVECGKCFKLKDSFLRHMRIHTDERPFTCHVCGKQFRDSGGLSRHLKDVHAKLKNFTCDICNKSFASKATREDHRRTHTGERPYVCDSCGKTFKSKASLFGLPQKRSFAAYCSWQQTFNETNLKESRKERISDNEDNSFDSFYNADLDMRKMVKVMLPPLNEIATSLKNQYTCKHCCRIFEGKYHLTRHIPECKSTTGSSTECSAPNAEDTNKGDKDREDLKCKKTKLGTYPCMYCDYTVKQKKLLELHLLDSHAEFARKKDKKLKCADREMVMRAKMEVDGKIYYHCNECGKNLYSPYTFFWHVRIHTGERSYTCHLCGKQFRINQGLARHLRDTHAGIKNFPCDVCGRMFSTKRSAEDHKRIHTGERPYICNICGKSFKQKASLFVHNRTHSDVFPFKCNYCDQNFRTRPSLALHIKKHTGEKPHACDICSRRFRIKYELKRHRLIHFDDKPWQCTECNLSFRQKRYLVNHRKVNHNPRLTWKVESIRSDTVVQISTVESESTNVEEVEYIQCAQCDVFFVNMKYFIDHMNNEHEAQMHYCQYCKLVYHGQDKDFEDHVSMHNSNCKVKDITEEDESLGCTNETRKEDKDDKRSFDQQTEKPPCYTCNLCERNFTKKSELKKHINRHSDINPIENPDETELVNKAKQIINDRVSYKCDMCKKIIFTKRGFLRHIRVHSDKRPCRCELCGKSYRIEQDLARHIRDVHEGLKKYACDICGRAFANKGAKDDHRRIHTGERPYACEHCPKMFRTLNSVYIHNRVHTDYKPHKCTYCGKHFRSRQRLTHHETTHTGIKAFACEICGKTFSVKGEVVRHRAIHNEEKPFDCKCGMKFGQKRYLRNHIKQHHKEASSWLLAELSGSSN